MRVLNALFLSASLALPLATPVLAQSADPAIVTVTGEATVEAAPDMATISLGVTTDGATAAAAMQSNSAALAAVIERLKASGVEDRDLQTANLFLNPNWVGYEAGATPRIAGYIASNTLNVRVRDLEKLGAILDASITDGANTLNGITFDLSTPRPKLDEARKAAVEDARARATLLVEAAGGKLGRIVSIAENSGYSAPAPMFRADAASAAPVPVEAGQLGMSASVTITFEIAN